MKKKTTTASYPNATPKVKRGPRRPGWPQTPPWASRGKPVGLKGGSWEKGKTETAHRFNVEKRKQREKPWPTITNPGNLTEARKNAVKGCRDRAPLPGWKKGGASTDDSGRLPRSTAARKKKKLGSGRKPGSCSPTRKKKKGARAGRRERWKTRLTFGRYRGS